MKTEIIEHLGQTDVLIPALIAGALRANDRVKARLSILQAAAHHAQAPDAARADLSDECRAAGLDSLAMEQMVAGATAGGGDVVTAPGLGELGRGVWDDVTEMAQGVAAGDAAAGAAGLERLAALRASHALGGSDAVSGAEVTRLTGLSGEGRDSLHRLVMDLHKALNRLSAEHAEENVAGAHAFGLRPEDHGLVEAFMRGLEATRRLKFDHPGLGTNAARAGERLTIQNDIGETDAHVVVIAVEPGAITVTYTDVHLARAKFFTGLLRDAPLAWSGLDRKSAAGLADDGVFYLVTGRCETDDPAVRDAVLEALGANLVFLIDWNKARKVLRAWIPKGEAVRVLDWAATHRLGHRAFLELGGSDLVAAAVNHAAPGRIGFGERLDGVLGREAAVDFLKGVLRICAEALLDGSSVRLARDRIEAELARHLERAEAMLFAIVIRQAGLAREVAAGLAAALFEQRAGRPFDRDQLAGAARRREEKADRIALDARQKVARFGADPAIERLSNQIEDVVDELEQAAFVASLLPPVLPADLLAPLSDLCGFAVSGAEAAASGAAAAAAVPEGHRVDSEDALACAVRLGELEHAADAAERAVTARVLGGGADLTTSLCALDLARALERATDRLAGFGHLLRTHVLADLAT
ncbi:hypothetical protein [Azorhizobium doebereinerae]|uniref:hypothetical protein n=1 Tax=Azorhizobium doebereinerae TaxID=281091 RepID=UPI00041D8D29|nr:hypothetical protein [Azorhizobium doebereinerae]